MQDIADALSTSRVSVWKVLNNRPGVSDLLRHQIWEKARELGYLPPESPSSAVPEAIHRRSVAVAVCRPESSLFWMKIIHQMAKDLSSRGVNLMYTYLPTSWKEGYSLPSSLSDGSASVSVNRFGNTRGADRYQFDTRTGQLTGYTPYKELDRSGKIRGWIYSMHVGSWGGLLTRLLWFVAALLGATLPLTGYYLWIRRLQKSPSRTSGHRPS